MPGAGQFDQEVNFYRANPTGAQNAAGEPIFGAPTLVWYTWAEVSPIMQQGREMAAVSQRWAEARYRLRFWRPDVDLKLDDWAEWNGQTLDLLDIQGPGTRDAQWTVFTKDHVE
jgi:hypothetical protein